METEKQTQVCPNEHNANGHRFRCYLAAGHPSKCEFPVDATVYQRPLETHDASWLASEVRALHVQIRSLERERAQDRNAHLLRSTIGRLISLAPANGTRKNVPADEVRAIWQSVINGEV